MDGMDLGGLMGMMGGLQQRMKAMQEEAGKTEVEGVAGGGLVKVVATCDQKIVSVHIAEGAADDRELLEDLVRAATNEALRLGREHMMNSLKEATGGLPIPPGLIPGFP
jgi:DNA-binding YbaB/EbfC family protein